MTIYTQMIHKVDIYKKVVAESADSGQVVATWAIETDDAACHYIPRFVETRVKPTYEETERHTMFFPADTVVDYGKRLYNIKDRKDQVIEAGPFEVVGILKHPGFGGKVHHIKATIRRVIES